MREDLKDMRPMLATLAEGPFDDPKWVFEVKWDGYRLMVVIEKGRASLISRNGIDVSRKYKDICKAFARIKKSAVIDGELVALDAHGLPRFQLMQNSAEANLVFYAFDLLSYDGNDLRDQPLLERKKRLKNILPKSARVRFSDHVEARGTRFFEEAEKKGLEGVMAKRADSRYLSGKRSKSWLKIKTSKRQETVVVGYTQPRHSRKHIGSLILAVREGAGWKYAGHTGGGMGGHSLKDVYDMLQPLRTDTKPLEAPREVERSATWVKPRVLAEIQFTEWTDAGTMRHPTVVGFRDDKPPKSVVRERQAKSAKPKNTSAVSITHADKVYWPKEKITKGDLIEYYDEMAGVILPYLKDRPMVLNRHPNGITKPGFYQKDSSGLNLPTFVETTTVRSESNDKNIRYVVVNNKETLLYVANLGCIELNPWNSRTRSLERPDFYVIDLDPDGNPFQEVVEVARATHDVLKLSCQQSFPKTSGKTGLHIYIPLDAQYPYEQARSFAHLVVRLVHERLPDITSLERSPKKRRGKIYLDYLQNRVGQTLAAPYSVRPAPGATVSAPLAWSEVKSGLKPQSFTMGTIRERLERKGDLFAGVLGAPVDLQKAIACLEKEYGTTKR